MSCLAPLVITNPQLSLSPAPPSFIHKLMGSLTIIFQSLEITTPMAFIGFNCTIRPGITNHYGLLIEVFMFKGSYYYYLKDQETQVSMKTYCPALILKLISSVNIVFVFVL